MLLAVILVYETICRNIWYRYVHLQCCENVYFMCTRKKKPTHTYSNNPWPCVLMLACTYTLDLSEFNWPVMAVSITPLQFTLTISDQLPCNLVVLAEEIYYFCAQSQQLKWLIFPAIAILFDTLSNGLASALSFGNSDTWETASGLSHNVIMINFWRPNFMRGRHTTIFPLWASTNEKKGGKQRRVPSSLYM